MSLAPALPVHQRELAALLGEEFVREAGGEDADAIDGLSPRLVVAPGDADQIAEVVRFANAAGLGVIPIGGGTKQDIGGRPGRFDLLLQTSRLRAVTHYDPGDLTIGVQAGMKVAEMQGLLAGKRQMLPLDLCDADRASIGGVMATAAEGPLRTGYGGIRDLCIGIDFVTGDGKRAKAGGRVVKNVAGYDLMKLLIGSYGTLAVIVGASFKVFPEMAPSETFILRFSTLGEAIRFRHALRKTALTPVSLELVSPHAREFLRRSGPVEDPDRFIPAKETVVDRDWWLCLRAAGSAAILDRYARELGGAVWRRCAGAEEQSLWAFAVNFRRSVRVRHRNAMLFSVSVPVQALEAAMASGERAALDYNFIPALLGRVASGGILVAFLPLSVDPPAAMQYAAAASAFRAGLPPQSRCIVECCPGEAKLHFDVWGSTPTDIELMRGVKCALDPGNVLNTERFLV